ncbi:CrcB family protein [Spirillospora sp. NPDC048819]|uniref:fluoride efflux transporter FluC n=1 Tax=Spirillospora sp. NPDC048819 TaxID=3155268 RepID=UPI0033C624C1
MPDSNAHGASHAVDSNVDPRVPQQRFRLREQLRRAPWATLAAISAGGVLGALARYGIGVAYPRPPSAFGWATLTINVSGCLLIGMLMAAIIELWQPHLLVRPFLGVGVLGGFTTFSTYIVDAQQAVEAGAPRTALAYLAATLVGALAAVYAGAELTRLLARARTHHGDDGGHR